MATNFNSQVSMAEFNYPDLIANDTIELAKMIREKVGRPMYFSRYGNVVNEGRDARPNHKGTSLHRPYINHEESVRTGVIVRDNSFPCRAIDFHFDFHGSVDYINLYLHLTKLVGVGGLGAYPWWNNPGFHIDTRTVGHPSSYARWYSYRDTEEKSKIVYTNIDEIQDLDQIAELV